MNKKIKRKIKIFYNNTCFNVHSWLFEKYAKIKHKVRIWKVLNYKSINLFNKNTPTLNNVQKRIVNNLQNDGISISSLDEVFPNENKLEELIKYIEKKQSRLHINHKKKFIEDYLSEIPELGFKIPFFSIAISSTMLDIVNTYIGMYSKLFHFMLRKTLPSDGLPHHSQNWHRTPQEKYSCSIYIYLNDVDYESGPFEYITQSTLNKKWANIAPQKATNGGYVTAEQIENTIPEKYINTITGKAGTVIFADTTGLHRGGYSTKKIRIMSTFRYGAPTYRENIHYSYTDKLEEKMQNLPAQSKYALIQKWKRPSIK